MRTAGAVPGPPAGGFYYPPLASGDVMTSVPPARLAEVSGIEVSSRSAPDLRAARARRRRARHPCEDRSPSPGRRPRIAPRSATARPAPLRSRERAGGELRRKTRPGRIRGQHGEQLARSAPRPELQTPGVRALQPGQTPLVLRVPLDNGSHEADVSNRTFIACASARTPNALVAIAVNRARPSAGRPREHETPPFRTRGAVAPGRSRIPSSVSARVTCVPGPNRTGPSPPWE